MWLYRYSYRLNSFFSHLLHIYSGNCKGKSVFCVQYVCSHWATARDAVGFAGSGHYSFLAAVLWFTAVICWGLFLHLSFSTQIPPSLNNSNHIPSHSAPISSPCPRWVPALGALQPAFSGVCMPLCSAWCSLSSRVAVQVVVLRCNRSPLVFFVY